MVQSYSDILSPVEIFSLITLAACSCQAYSVASQVSED